MILATILCLQILAGGFLHVEGRKGFGESEQEWGYVTVRPYAEMFWWLYYTTSTNVSNAYEKPLLIWLQGGPGASSTGYGNFEELGPVDSNLKPRNHTWIKDYNVLFIDNPVGTGYSYAKSSSGYSRDNKQIAKDLIECMRGFYKQDPKWSKVPVYITSESYGGKMAAEFALLWDEAQRSGNITSNLKGVMMIDSWISPIDSVLSWADFLLETGMVDTAGYKKIAKAANETRTAVENEEWTHATYLWSVAEQVIMQQTGNIDFYNILYETSYGSLKSSPSGMFKPILPSGKVNRDDTDARLDRLMNSGVKKALNVSVVWGSQAGEVFGRLGGDFMRPVIDIVERLLNETKIEVLVVTGQLDLIVATPGTVAWVERLQWRNSKEWHNAKRSPLVVNNVIEGYVKQFDNFKMYWINRSGHMVPADNYKATAAMLKHMTASANN